MTMPFVPPFMGRVRQASDTTAERILLNLQMARAEAASRAPLMQRLQNTLPVQALNALRAGMLNTFAFGARAGQGMGLMPRGEAGMRTEQQIMGIENRAREVARNVPAPLAIAGDLLAPGPGELLGAAAMMSDSGV